MVETERRTFGWYVDHYVHEDGTTSLRDRPSVTAPATSVGARNFAEAGLLDEIPTLENMRPLIDMYAEWWPSVDRDWSNYTREEGKLLVTLHWFFGDFFRDPATDPEIIRYAFERCPKLAICCVSSRACPEDVVRRAIGMSKSKDDPTTKTNGGELVCFVLQNRTLSADLVDACARKTKKASRQYDALRHPNVSRETLVYLAKEGRSPRVKSDALMALVGKGFLKIE